jgi:hypothetical protein
MKKLILTLVTFLLVTSTVQAQERVKATPKKAADAAKKEATAVTSDSDWKTGGTGRANFALNSFGNWAAGAVNTTTIDGNLGVFADYGKDKLTWTNGADFALGIIKSEVLNDFRKSGDLIDLHSRVGYKINDELSWTTPITFRSQFAPTRTYFRANPNTDSTFVFLNQNGFADANTSNIVAKFLSPALVTVGSGITWTPKKANNDVVSFKLEFLPIQFQGTIVADDAIAGTPTKAFVAGSTTLLDRSKGIYGNIIDTLENKVQKFRPQLGSGLNIGFAYKGIKNVVFSSNLGLFENFISNSFGDFTQKAQLKNVDVNWANKLDFNYPISLFGKTFNFNATLAHFLLYDADVAVYQSDRTTIVNAGDAEKSGIGAQSRLYFGTGLTYQFGYKK